MKTEDITPKEITIDSQNNCHIAHFSYYDGIQFAKENDKHFTMYYKEVVNENKYMVACGDIMIRVEKTDYLNIVRTY